MKTRDDGRTRRKVLLLLCIALGVVAYAGNTRAQSSTSNKELSVSPIGQPQKAETLVGRGSQAGIVRRDGSVEEVSKQNLRVLNRSNVQESPVPAAKKTRKQAGEEVKVDEDKPAHDVGKPTEKNEPAKENPADTSADGKAPEEQNAEAKAISEPPGKRSQSSKNAVAANAKRKAEIDPKQQAEAEAITKSNVEQLRKLQWQNAWFYDKKGNPISQEDLNKRIEKGDVSDIQTKDIYLQEWKTEKMKSGDSSQQSAPSEASAPASTETMTGER